MPRGSLGIQHGTYSTTSRLSASMILNATLPVGGNRKTATRRHQCRFSTSSLHEWADLRGPQPQTATRHSDEIIYVERNPLTRWDQAAGCFCHASPRAILRTYVGRGEMNSSFTSCGRRAGPRLCLRMGWPGLARYSNDERLAEYTGHGMARQGNPDVSPPVALRKER